MVRRHGSLYGDHGPGGDEEPLEVFLAGPGR